MVTDTEWGRVWAWRVLMGTGFALCMAGVAVAGRRAGLQEGSSRLETAFRLLALGFGGAALWTLSLTSHGAATAGIRWFALSVDYIHLVASALWVGGLFHLAIGIPLMLRSLAPEERRECLSAMVPRFSVVAGLSVVVLIVTGVFSTWAQVTIVPAVETPYGMTLLAKLGIVMFILMLAGLNLVWVRPRLARNDGAARWLRRLVMGEAALAVVVLGAVGVLTSLEPARQVAGTGGEGGCGLASVQGHGGGDRHCDGD